METTITTGEITEEQALKLIQQAFTEMDASHQRNIAISANIARLQAESNRIKAETALVRQDSTRIMGDIFATMERIRKGS